MPAYHERDPLTLLLCWPSPLQNIENLKNEIEDPEEVDGMEDLKEEDKEKVKTAYENGHGERSFASCPSVFNQSGQVGRAVEIRTPSSSSREAC